MQTEKAKSSHFDRTRGFKNQIFPTFMPPQLKTGCFPFLNKECQDPARFPFPSFYHDRLQRSNPKLLHHVGLRAALTEEDDFLPIRKAPSQRRPFNKNEDEHERLTYNISRRRSGHLTLPRQLPGQFYI